MRIDVLQCYPDCVAGGMPGSERLRDSSALKELLEQQQASDRFVTAICAAPAVVLEAQGLLKGKKATSHPGFTDKLSDKRCLSYCSSFSPPAALHCRGSPFGGDYQLIVQSLQIWGQPSCN